MNTVILTNTTNIRGVWWKVPIGRTFQVVGALIIPSELENVPQTVTIKHRGEVLHQKNLEKNEGPSKKRLEKNNNQLLHVFKANLPEPSSYLIAILGSHLDSKNTNVVKLDFVNEPCPEEIVTLAEKKLKLTLNTTDVTDGYAWFIKKTIEQIDGIIANL